MSLDTHAEGKWRDLGMHAWKKISAGERMSVLVGSLQALNLIGHQAQTEIVMPSRSSLQGRVSSHLVTRVRTYKYVIYSLWSNRRTG